MVEKVNFFGARVLSPSAWVLFHYPSRGLGLVFVSFRSSSSRIHLNPETPTLTEEYTLKL